MFTAIALWAIGIFVIHFLVEEELHDAVDWAVLIGWPLIPLLWAYDRIVGAIRK